MSTNLIETTTNGNSLVGSEHSMGATTASREDFRFWRVNNGDAASLLKEIIFRWRGNNGRLPDRPEKFTVYPLTRWAKWMGWLPDENDADLPEKTVKSRKRKVMRELDKLEEEGLIFRIKRPFAGPIHHAYLSPTLKALRLAQGYGAKKQDVTDYEKGLRPVATAKYVATPVTTAVTTPVSSPVVTNTPPSTLTTSPTSSKKSSLPSLAKKGNGEGLPQKMKKATDVPAVDLLEQVKAVQKQWKGSKDKEGHIAALIELMPKLDAKKTVHPSELKRKAPWRTWSPELLVKNYLNYEQYVANEVKAANAKPNSAVQSVPTGKALKQYTDAEIKDAQAQWDAEQLAEKQAWLAEMVEKLPLNKIKYAEAVKAGDIFAAKHHAKTIAKYEKDIPALEAELNA